MDETNVFLVLRAWVGFAGEGPGQLSAMLVLGLPPQSPLQSFGNAHSQVPQIHSIRAYGNGTQQCALQHSPTSCEPEKVAEMWAAAKGHAGTQLERTNAPTQGHKSRTCRDDFALARLGARHGLCSTADGNVAGGCTGGDRSRRRETEGAPAPATGLGSIRSC